MATRSQPLRAVTPGEKAPARAKTLAEAAEAGSYLDILIAQRREMIRDVRDMNGPAKAAMHRQIALSSKEIAALQAAAEEEAAESGVTPDEAFDASAI